MPPDIDPRTGLAGIGGSAILLAGGILVTVVSVRDFLLYLDSYDLTMVGTTNGLLGVVLLSVLGALLMVSGLLWTVSLAVTDGSNE